MTRYFIGFLLAVGLIVVVIVLIIRGLTSGPKAPKQLLDDYSTSDVSVQLTIDSPVSASDTHKDIIINVSNTQATLMVTQGYEHQMVRMKSYPMNVSGYEVFLKALRLNGFTQGNSDPNARDERGQCALRDRFVYQIIDGNGSDLQRFWYTSCNNGTFSGNASTVRHLFTLQIPDYSKLTSDVHL